MRILSSVLLLTLAGCSTVPKSLPAPEPIIKTVTEFKTLEIYQPPLPSKVSIDN
jgi:starvation-inducible outer membrane lipoprotein